MKIKSCIFSEPLVDFIHLCYLSLNPSQGTKTLLNIFLNLNGWFCGSVSSSSQHVYKKHRVNRHQSPMAVYMQVRLTIFFGFVFALRLVYFLGKRPFAFIMPTASLIMLILMVMKWMLIFLKMNWLGLKPTT